MRLLFFVLPVHIPGGVSVASESGRYGQHRRRKRCRFIASPSNGPGPGADTWQHTRLTPWKGPGVEGEPGIMRLCSGGLCSLLCVLLADQGCKTLHNAPERPQTARTGERVEDTRKAERAHRSGKALLQSDPGGQGRSWTRQDGTTGHDPRGRVLPMIRAADMATRKQLLFLLDLLSDTGKIFIFFIF